MRKPWGLVGVAAGLVVADVYMATKVVDLAQGIAANNAALAEGVRRAAELDALFEATRRRLCDALTIAKNYAKGLPGTALKKILTKKKCESGLVDCPALQQQLERLKQLKRVRKQWEFLDCDDDPVLRGKGGHPGQLKELNDAIRKAKNAWNLYCLRV
jgi:hypothetical protein